MRIVAKPPMDIRVGDLLVFIQQGKTIHDHLPAEIIENLRTLNTPDDDIFAVIETQMLSFTAIEIIGRVSSPPDYIDDHQSQVKIYTDALECPCLDSKRSTPRMFYLPGDMAYVLEVQS